MKRPVTGFGLDAEGDWFAILNCGHRQHVRHRPPFFERPWVTTESGRNGKLGTMLDCVRCDRFELPDAFVLYKKTPIFTEHTIPAAFKKDHSTKAGVWARINVLAGRLRYIVDALDTDMALHAGTPGIIQPEVPHRVEPQGPVRFFLEMYRAPKPAN